MADEDIVKIDFTRDEFHVLMKALCVIKALRGITTSMFNESDIDGTIKHFEYIDRYTQEKPQLSEEERILQQHENELGKG